MSPDHTRIRETLGQPELNRVVERLRTRLERGKDLRGILALPDATPAERDAMNRLLGRAPAKGTTIAISLDRLDEKLRAAGICLNLREAVEELTGPIKDLRAEREALEGQWNVVFTSASARIAGRMELDKWLARLRASGLLRRYGVATAHPSSLRLSRCLSHP